jgi:hypothetical protein
LGEIYKKQLSNVAAFRYANGWYVLVLGPFTAGTAAPIRDHLIRISAIPSDSVVTPGDGFENLMWGDHPKPAPAPSYPSQEQASQRAVKAVREFFETATLSNKTALHFLDRLYPPETTYFGKQVSREYALEQKRLFLERWPERTYTLQPATLSTTCNKTENSCTVTGIVDWRASSKKRKASAEGTSRFQLTFSIGGQLLSEWSEVLSRRKLGTGPQTKFGTCFFEVDGVAQLDGSCRYVRWADRGDILIGSVDESTPWASVKHSPPGEETRGEAWQEGELGQVRPDGACWINERTRICVWKLGESANEHVSR